jgi:hypothetical protein
VDPVPDTLLLRKSGSAVTSGLAARDLPLDHRGISLLEHINKMSHSINARKFIVSQVTVTIEEEPIS